MEWRRVGGCGGGALQVTPARDATPAGAEFLHFQFFTGRQDGRSDTGPFTCESAAIPAGINAAQYGARRAPACAPPTDGRSVRIHPDAGAVLDAAGAEGRADPPMGAHVPRLGRIGADAATGRPSASLPAAPAATAPAAAPDDNPAAEAAADIARHVIGCCAQDTRVRHACR